MKQLFYNGVIYPTATTEPVSCILVEDTRILALGERTDLEHLAGEAFVSYDLHGKCVLPGFQDSHCHLFLTGMQKEALDLSNVTSRKELILRTKAFIKEHNIKEGDWVIGRGFNQNQFDPPILPDKADVDEISLIHPILLDRVCGHTGTLNSLAIKKIGLTTDTQISGGEIAKDSSGALTGILYETALDYAKSKIPAPDFNKSISILREACQYANSLGLTSVHSNDTTVANLAEFLLLLKELEAQDQLSLRIYEEVQASSLLDLAAFESQPYRTGDGNDYYKIGNIKLFTDGSLGARSAFMQEAYLDEPQNQGIPVYDKETLFKILCKADEMGMQVACHAIGDGAVLACIEAIEAAQEKNRSRNRRHRIVHCQFAGDDLLLRMKQANIASDIQPPFVATDWQVAEQAVGTRTASGYRWKTMRDLGLHLGGGSDSPVESLSPIWGIHTAVNRMDKSENPKGGWHPNEKLSVQEAVSLYTEDVSYLSFEEERKGKLAPGYLADFVVLSENIFFLPPERIKEIQIEMTVVGGRIRYLNQQPPH